MSPTHRKREVKKDISEKIKCEKKSRDRKISTYSYVESKVRTYLLAANMTERDRANRPAGRPGSSHEPPLIHRRSAFSFFVITIPPSARRSVEALLSRAASRCAWPPTVATAMAVACGGSSVVSFLHRFTCALPARTRRPSALADARAHAEASDWLSSFCRRKL